MGSGSVMESERVELVFVPSPSISHLVPTVEVAKLLIRHDHRLSITFIIFEINKIDSKLTAYIDSVSTAGRINFITIPINIVPDENKQDQSSLPMSLVFLSMVEKNKHLVKEAVEEMARKHAAGSAMRLAGFVIDMFCTPMIDVANQLGAPTYLFFVCSAAFLSFQFYTEELLEQELSSENLHLEMPMFRSSYPAKVLPPIMFHTKSAQLFTKMSQRFRETKGVLVNTFQELQSYVIDTLTTDKRIPPVYPVGPIINLERSHDDDDDAVIKWLDDQPAISVVYLCFGSMGSFDAEQVREIAAALEGSGHRFLWCLQRPSTDVRATLLTTDFGDVEEVLPEGFLSRTAGTGKVIGWAPQMAILSHPAVGGFVSHCGWNSVLESLWCGVPLAAWPFASDNQVNAFEMVVELGLGVDLRMDYRKDQLTREPNMLVTAVEIETAIRKLMELKDQSEARKKVKKMSELSRKALTEGGSSRTNLRRFLTDHLLASTSTSTTLSP